MSMSWAEHLKRSEDELGAAEKNLATAQTQNDFRSVEILVQIAICHAHLAETKRVRV